MHYFEGSDAWSSKCWRFWGQGYNPCKMFEILSAKSCILVPYGLRKWPSWGSNIPVSKIVTELVYAWWNVPQKLRQQLLPLLQCCWEGLDEKRKRQVMDFYISRVSVGVGLKLVVPSLCYHIKMIVVVRPNLVEFCGWIEFPFLPPLSIHLSFAFFYFVFFLFSFALPIFFFCPSLPILPE